MESDDREAIGRTLAGDTEGFGILVRRYQGLIYRFLLKMTRSPEDAEDLAQETFVEAFRCLGRLRRHESFRSWICRIAWNKAIDHERRCGPRRKATLRMDELKERTGPEAKRLALASAGPALGSVMQGCVRGEPEFEILRRERLEALETAIGQLPARYRAVIHLKCVEGMKVEEIAGALEMSTRTVETQLYRARKHLRAALEGMGWYVEA